MNCLHAVSFLSFFIFFGSLDAMENYSSRYAKEPSSRVKKRQRRVQKYRNPRCDVRMPFQRKIFPAYHPNYHPTLNCSQHGCNAKYYSADALAQHEASGHHVIDLIDVVPLNYRIAADPSLSRKVVSGYLFTKAIDMAAFERGEAQRKVEQFRSLLEAETPRVVSVSPSTSSSEGSTPGSESTTPPPSALVATLTAAAEQEELDESTAAALNTQKNPTFLEWMKERIVQHEAKS